jgi:sulfane dehydrogenase subunit SoxC
MSSNKRDRRRFLKESAALAGLALGAVRSASGQAPATGGNMPAERAGGFRAYGERSRFEKALRTMPPETPGFTPLQDLVGIITPSALHYVNSHYNVPEIDPQQHRLLIHGMVDRPLIFTMEELKRLPSVSRVHFLECNDNSAGSVRGAKTVQAHGRTSCAEWSGVLLSTLLKEAGVQAGASWLVAEGNDSGKHSKSIPLEKAMEDTIVAYGQNGEPIRPENGYPLRLLIPGFSGVSNIKWLRRIKVVDQPYMQKAEAAGYSSVRLDGKARWFMMEMPPKSLITRPSGGQQLAGPGFYEITGLAWSGRGTIRKVEISTDGGRTWKEAQLQEPIHRIAHTRFRFPWNWNGEEAVLQSRCTDDLDQTQPSLAEFSQVWKVDLEYWKATRNPINIFNPIQPWKVNRDGSIDNALV